MDRPSDAETWLLRRDDPALPRVIQAVRPLVLPKLREEFERARARSGAKARKKGVKDVVVEGMHAWEASCSWEAGFIHRYPYTLNLTQTADAYEQTILKSPYF